MNQKHIEMASYPEHYHVYPIGDLEEHDTENRGACKCKPRFEEGVWIHNSYDRREYFEDDTELVLPTAD